MRRYFITGLLIWIPLVITLWVLNLLIGMLDQSLLLVPESLRPLALIGLNIPGVGAILTVLVIFLTGVLAANIIGQRLVRFWEALLARIPVVKSIYYSVKQVSDTLFSGNGEAFRKVLLVRYPIPNHGRWPSRPMCQVKWHPGWMMSMWVCSFPPRPALSMASISMSRRAKPSSST